MLLIDLLGVYKCYNDLEVIDNNTQEIVDFEKALYSKDYELLEREILGVRAIPYQSEENAYFMDNEMRIMIKAKVKVWLK